MNEVNKKSFVTIQHARKRLGKKAEKLSDKDIEAILNLLRVICNKVIDSAITQAGSYSTS